MNYVQKRDNARDTIKRFSNGATAVFASSGGTYNPDTSSVTPGSAGSKEAYAVILPVDLNKFNQADSLVQATDDMLMVAAVTLAGVPFELSPNDATVFGGRTYTIVAVNTLRPDGVTSIYHDCAVRGV